MIVFINVACGAGSSCEPNPYALPRNSSVAATAQHAVAAPMYCPTCCSAGVAPTCCSVFKSCEMSPAFDAAIATTVPTISSAT
jgi:hypothetical protein